MLSLTFWCLCVLFWTGTSSASRFVNSVNSNTDIEQLPSDSSDLKPLALGLDHVHEHNNTPYSWDTGATYLMYSYSAYCSEDLLKNWGCYWCTRNHSLSTTVTAVFWDDKTHTYGFAGFNSREIVVSFRGSQDLINWIYNLRFPKTAPYDDIPNARVHKGFYQCYESVQTELRPAIAALVQAHPDLPIVVTGHSLGGAIAVICAVDLDLHVVQGKIPISVWTYGAPRVGNAEFSDFYDTHTDVSWRTVNQNDIVPHLPFTSMGFEHTTRESWFPNDFVHFKECSPDNGEDPSCSASVSQWAESIDDHLDYLGFYLSQGDSSGC